jgi:hypothetical protein
LPSVGENVPLSLSVLASLLLSSPSSPPLNFLQEVLAIAVAGDSRS